MTRPYLQDLEFEPEGVIENIRITPGRLNMGELPPLKPLKMGLSLRLLRQYPEIWLQHLAVNVATWWLRRCGLHVVRLHARTAPQAGEGDRLEFEASGYHRVVCERAERRRAEAQPR